MNIDDLTIGEARKFFGGGGAPLDNRMVGKYVVVRCREAGVHAGILESYSGRECVLLHSRRLWYWKPAEGQKFLSGVAIAGLDAASKLGAPLPRIHLTENCEIIECTGKAELSIRAVKTDESDKR